MMTQDCTCIGSVEMFRGTDVQVVLVDGIEIAVFRLAENRYVAVGNQCPHEGGSLADGIRTGEFVYCPLHNQKIRLVDGMVQYPDTGCIQTYPVWRSGPELYLEFPALQKTAVDQLPAT